MQNVIETELLQSIIYYCGGQSFTLDCTRVGNTLYYSCFKPDLMVFIKKNSRHNVSYFRTVVQATTDLKLGIFSAEQFQGVFIMQRGELAGVMDGARFLWQPYNFAVCSLNHIDLTMELKAGTYYVFLFIQYKLDCFTKFEHDAGEKYSAFVSNVMNKRSQCLYPTFLPVPMQMVFLAADLYDLGVLISEDYYFEIKALEILEIALRPLFMSVLVTDVSNINSHIRTLIYEFVDWVLEGEGFQYSLGDFLSQRRKSRPYFSRIFKKIFEMSPQEFMELVRMKRARELAATGQYDAQWIANRLGYRKKRTLQERFMRHHGIPFIK